MSKPLDLIEVMARAIANYEGCGLAMCRPTHCHCRNSATAALAALEKEGYGVTLKDPISRNRVIVHFSGVSHPQAPYTPEPRKEES